MEFQNVWKKHQIHSLEVRSQHHQWKCFSHFRKMLQLYQLSGVNKCCVPLLLMNCNWSIIDRSRMYLFIMVIITRALQFENYYQCQSLECVKDEIIYRRGNGMKWNQMKWNEMNQNKKHWKCLWKLMTAPSLVLNLSPVQ